MNAKKVSAGIVVYEQKIFIAQRKKGKSLEYFWEFPGGKLEENETLPECLSRELMEEFSMKTKVGSFFMESAFDYEFGTIILHAYFVECQNPKELTIIDHEQIKWVELKELAEYNFAPADCPIVNKLLELKSL